jgi:hypothetical protein
MTTKEQCDYNNGVWKNYECKPTGSGTLLNKNIRASDLCERTGFKYNNESNLCYKEEEDSGGTRELMDYCENKTKTSTQGVNWGNYNIGHNVEKYPCSVCKWKHEGQLQQCEALPRENCTNLAPDQCGEYRPGTVSVPSACEYYRHNMESAPVTVPGITEDQDIRQSEFMCSESADVSTTNTTCSSFQTLETCEPVDPTGCEWQCPLAQGADHPEYTFTRASDSGTVEGTLLGVITRDKYYSPASIHVTCATGYKPNNLGDSTLPKAQCIRNSDDSTVGNHSEILGFIGCVKKLNCQNTEFTPEKIQTMFSNDSSSVPSEFTTDNELDQGKFPDANGNFKCPRPSRIIDTPDDQEGWDEDTCCTNIGLCTGNDIGIDVVCPTGQEIRMTYYEGNPTLSPHVGTTPEECCAPPEVPTITVPLDADYEELMADEATFREDFISDIVGIMNESTDITITITADMIEIVNIAEGSIIVTFKVKKDKEGGVVLKDQISKTLTVGTTFTRIGAVTKGEPGFKEYDPADQFDFYSKAFKTGISIEELIISIVITISLCLFCLVVMGMLMK